MPQPLDFEPEQLAGIPAFSVYFGLSPPQFWPPFTGSYAVTSSPLMGEDDGDGAALLSPLTLTLSPARGERGKPSCLPFVEKNDDSVTHGLTIAQHCYLFLLHSS